MLVLPKRRAARRRSNWSPCLPAIAVLLAAAAPVSGGSIINSVPFENVQFTDNAATAPVFNMTELGSVDWALYGAQVDPGYLFGQTYASPFEADYSKDGGTAIGPMQTLLIADDSAGGGFRTAVQFANDGQQPQPGAGFEGAFEYAWTDGTPTPSGQSPAALALFDREARLLAEKVVVEIAASTQMQRLWVFPQSKRAAGTIEFSLDDGATTSLLLEDLFAEEDGNSVDDDANGSLAIDFVADTPGSTLTLTMTQGTAYAESPNNFRGVGVAALALGALSAPEPGDYNADGNIDQLDYVVWRDTYGSATDLRADGNDDSTIDAGDYTVWRDALAGGTGLAPAAAPEPSSFALLLSLAPLWRRSRR